MTHQPTDPGRGKRIARNTLLLYVRMLFMLLVGLYTSRVILRTLGVQDYGIYNVVGGVIAMLGFVQGSLSSASSRFITYDLGKGDMAVMKRTFGNILSIHLLFATLIFILGETIGLWFVLEKLNIPESRRMAALWVYQFSIFTSIISFVSVPYNAAIIAHERMSAFAYISIYEAVAKLSAVFLLQVTPFDKLVVYALLLFLIQCSSRIIYNAYCFRHFSETKARLCIDRVQFREIFSFAGWTMNGSLAVMGYTQGLNIVLNLFFGPAVNAARGIAVQVQAIVQQFCQNFQMALNPQITKSYAQDDLDYMHKLIIVSSKFSFFILLFIALPLMLEADLVLHWWLGTVPNHAVSFLRLVLCTSLLFTLSNPILISVHATGQLKKFQLVEGTMLLSIVPIAYLLLKFFNIPPESVFLVHIVVEMCTQMARLKIVLPMIKMRVSAYLSRVMCRVLLVVCMAPLLPLAVYLNLPQTVASFFLVCAFSVVSLTLCVYFFGCNPSERAFAIKKLQGVKRRIIW